MKKRSRYLVLISLLLMATAGILARAAYTKGFTKKWREKLSREFAERGVHLEMERLTLDPVRGLVARDVTVYNDQEKSRVVAKINRITLDVELSSVFDDALFLDSIDLKDANLWFYLDPDDPESERLELHNFNSRIFLTGDRVQIGRGEGLVNDVDVSVRGLFFATGKMGEDQEDVSDVVDQALEGAVKWINRLNFDNANRPKLQINIHGGDLDQPETLHASVHFVGEDIRLGGYECDNVEALLETGGGAAVLKRFSVEDSFGRLDLNGEYRFGDDSLRFHLESEANLPGFLSGALGWKELSRVVFYSPPKVSADGELVLRGNDDGGTLLQATGKILCGRVNSRGKIFESIQSGFSIAGSHFYLRDTVVEHRSGSLSGDAMLDENGFRYRAKVTMDPEVIAPFCSNADNRLLIQKFKFGRDSTIYAEIRGSGVDAVPSNWESEAEVEFRNFNFGGVDYRKFESDLMVNSGVQEYRNIEVTQGDSEYSADLLRLDQVNQIAEIRGFQGDAGAVNLLESLFGDQMKKLKGYRFGGRTSVTADGVLDLGARGQDAMKIRVEADRFEFKPYGQTIPLERFTADLSIIRDRLNLDIQSQVSGGDVRGELYRGYPDFSRHWSGMIGFDNVEFDRLLGTNESADRTGGSLSGEFRFVGAPKLTDAKIDGVIHLKDGNLFAVAPLREVPGLVKRRFPTFQYDGLVNASGEFQVENGMLRSGAVVAETSGFEIRAAGEVDLNNGRLDVSVKAAPGPGEGEPFPDEKASSLTGSGSVDHPEWK